jgi:CubicO group peptidase (beta-lactamase class C family)
VPIRPLRPPRRALLGALAGSLLAATGGAAQSRAPVEAVERYLQAELARQRIPGLSVAVLRGDSLVLARGYGWADVEHRVPASDSTVYQSGSVGKQFTAAAIVLLAEEGRLGLDDPVRRHLPDGPAAWDAITLRHLLTHTSGLPDYADSTLDYRRDYTEDDLLRLAVTLPVEFPPGTRWSYSNTGYVLLGAVIRRVTGAFYGDFLRDRIFQPLGMRTARIISEQEIVPNRSDGYRLVDGRLAHQEWVAPTLNTAADGSLYLTVRDLARWAIGLNHRRVPSARGLETSWTPVTLRSGGTYPYGLGWDLSEQRGRRRIGHGGSWQGFRTSIQRYPEFDLTVMVLANLAEAEPEALSYAVAGMLEPALAAPHLLPPAGGGPPIGIPALLAGVAAGEAGAGITPALRAFLSPRARAELGELLAPAVSWTSLGCDDVTGRAITRLGERIARVCYARGTGGEAHHLVEVGYTGGGKAAAIDWYDF